MSIVHASGENHFKVPWNGSWVGITGSLLFGKGDLPAKGFFTTLSKDNLRNYDYQKEERKEKGRGGYEKGNQNPIRKPLSRSGFSPLIICPGETGGDKFPPLRGRDQSTRPP
jgi:hypothetical protein